MPLKGIHIWLVPVVLALFLIGVSQYNFLLFHSLAEIFAIMVAVILSVVAWHTYSFSRNHFLMYLGIGYFWIGLLDLFHTLSYKGMGVFIENGAMLSTQFWIVSRYFEACLLLSSGLFLSRKIHRTGVMMFFGLTTTLVYFAVISGYIPETFVDGQGLTAFKVNSEYIIVGILVASVLILYRNRSLIEQRIFILMASAIILTAAAELVFTLYSNLFGYKIIAGHLLKLFSYWLVFVAIVRTTLTEPYQVMARGSSTYDAIPVPTIVVDKHGLILQANRAACITTGLSVKDVLTQHCHALFHPQDTGAGDCLLCQYIEKGQTLTNYEINFPGKEGWREFTLTPFETFDDNHAMVHVSPDITERKIAQEELVFQANYDSLTQLPNRVLATDRLIVAIKRAQRNNLCVAVMFVDIDNFKNINDTLGHSFGDKVIFHVSQKIVSCVRDSDTLARWGGDEYVIILPELHSIQESESVAEKILNVLSKQVTIEGRVLTVSASIGIAGFPYDGVDYNTLLSHADSAMYSAKNAEKNTYRFFTRDMNESAAKRMLMEFHLRGAIEHDEFTLFYQPQIDLDSRKVVGCEALLRWNNSELGHIPPMHFIPLAEETGQISSIGYWVLRTACKDLARWQKLGYSNMTISVNVSSKQLKNRKFVDELEFILKETAIEPDKLILELTENVLLNDEPETLEILTRIDSLGCKLSLDDFGTGYSSLNYLKKYPFKEIKIDRSFVNDVINNADDATLCRAIVAMAKSLKLTVVGEGVEEENQCSFLHKIGAHIAQGFHFNRPVPADQFLTYLDEYN